MVTRPGTHELITVKASRVCGQDVDREAEFAETAVDLEDQPEVVAAAALRLNLPSPGGGVVEDQRDRGLGRADLASLVDGDSHVVDLSEHLGGVSFRYLTAPDGVRLIVEAHDQRTPRPGSRTGLEVTPGAALFFEAEPGRRLQ